MLVARTLLGVRIERREGLAMKGHVGLKLKDLVSKGWGGWILGYS